MRNVRLNASTGFYDVRINDATGQNVTLDDAFEVIVERAPEFFVDLIIPSRTRPGRKATITVEYGNSGTVDMMSPLLTLTSDDDMQWRVPGTETFVTTGNFQILALSTTGTANILRPGQTETLDVKITTPFRQATINYGVSVLGANPETDGSMQIVDWEALQENSRPESTNAEAWDAIWGNVEQHTGATWGDFVAMLGDNAAHLARLDEMTYDLSSLFNFEVVQASSWNPNFVLASAVDADVPTPGLPLTFSRVYGQTIPSRYALGPLGRGWTHNYDLFLNETQDGDVLMHGPTGSFRFFAIREDGSFQSAPGDYGVLTLNGDGTYSLREKDGLTLRFGTDFKLRTITDRNANSISAGYNTGLLTSLIHSSGQQLTLEYNTAGRITRLVDRHGRATAYTYDATGEHLSTVTQYGNQTTRYAYAKGQQPTKEHALLSTQFPSGNHVFYEYDAQGRLVSRSLDGGTVPIAYSYDTAGTLSATDAIGAETKFLFDANGILREIHDALGNISRIVLDENFNISQTIRPDGLGSNLEYDEFGNLRQFVDPIGNSTVFGYDSEFSNLLYFRDARRNISSYDYDPNNNLVAIVNPAGLAETFQVDELGNITQTTNRRGNTLRFTYNPDGQLTRKDFADGTFTEYLYSDGSLVSTIDSHGVTAFEYERDLLKKVTYPSGRFLAYEYDTVRRKTLSDQDGLLVSYDYDVTGQLKTLTDGDGTVVVTYVFDARGFLARENRGNGTFTEYDYDPAGRLTSITHSTADGHSTGFFNYTYDSLSRRVEAETHYGTWTYSYDAIDQLVGASLVSNDPNIASIVIAYDYDATGNRVRTTVDGEVTDYVANQLNQYVQVGEDQYIYDADGNLLMVVGPSNSRKFVFDDQNQLLESTIDDEIRQYFYDALGNRVLENAADEQHELVYDPIGLSDLVADVNLVNGEATKYFHGFGLVSQQDVTGQYFLTYDALGSTSQIVDPSGVVVNKYAFKPFGERLFEFEGIGNKFTFVGGWGVVDDGSVYQMRARHYDPHTGRFVSQDPIGLVGGPNFYAYTANNPTNLVDSSGLYPGLQESQDLSQRLARELLDRVYEIAPKGDLPKPDDSDQEYQNYQDSLEALLPLPDGFLPWCYPNCPPPPVSPGGDDSGGGSGQNDPSYTPEDKFGPVGYDLRDVPVGQEKRFVAGTEAFHYRIDFWNKPDAIVPTQDAIIVDTLDPNFDWRTLNFTNFGFLKWNVDLPGGQVIDTQVDLRPDMNLAVNVQATFDQEAGEIRWWFQAIDPATGDYPEDPFAGFLPPFNEETQYELGWVEFTVEPKASLSTGDRIQNLALVQFDFIGPFNPAPKNADGSANPWVNTIDVGAPTSHVARLDDETRSRTFDVSWAGTDDTGGSGVARFDVFSSMNGAPYEIWQQGTTQTSAAFTGESGRTYRFFSVAIDNVGNRELPPLTPDAETTVVAAPTVTLAVDNATIAENSGVATFTATLSAVASLPVTVDLGFTGTATVTADYTRSGTQIVIPAGQTTRSITVTAADDTLIESNETVIVDIASVTNATELDTQQATTTILDDDLPLVALGVDKTSIAENGGMATFTATLSAVTSQPVTVNLGFTGTATLTADYTHSGTQIVIAAGQTTSSIVVTAVQDSLDEANETVIVDITGVTNGTEQGTQQRTATITDDDGPSVALAVNDPTIGEAGGVATFTATLSAVSSVPVTVDLGFTGTATLTDDYTRSGTQIVIAAGQTTSSIVVTAVQDSLDEANETVIVDITGVTNGTEQGTQQEITTILDDDLPLVTLGVDSATITENGDVATFTATLSAVTSQPVTVDLGFTGTATLSADYTRSGTQIVIAAGQTTGSVTVTAVQDTLIENAETVIVDIVGVINGTEQGEQRATATITDDDGPLVTFSVNDATIGEAGGVGLFTASLSPVSSLPVTVDLGFTGTATLTDDYTRSNTQIVIPAGATSGTIIVTAVQDTLIEDDETVIVDITGVTNATESGTQQATIAITDDDSPRVTLAVNDATIGEAGGVALFTASLSPVSSLPVTVDLGFMGTATLTDDYTRSGTQIVIPPGATSGAIAVTALDDTLAENNETVIVDITGVTNGTEAGTQQATATITDDDGPPAKVIGVGINGIGNANRSGVATLVLQFDQAVTVNSVNSLKIYNHTTGLPVDISSGTLQNDGTTEVTWNLSGITFPDGYYTATLPKAEAGLATTHSYLFHILAGDSSGNAQVDFADFGHLATNFNTINGPMFGPGDMDGNGNVDFGDFGILAGRFNTILAAPSMDFGDAPEFGTSYPTTRVNNGARHLLGSGPLLGSEVDSEADGQPNFGADGDGSDEDGVAFAAIQAGTAASLAVTAAVPGTAVLNAWIDFNADWDWDDVGEQIFIDQGLSNGTHNLTTAIPPGAVAGPAFARFRITSTAGYSYFGLASDGEVEDYLVTIAAASSRGLPDGPVALWAGSFSDKRRGGQPEGISPQRPTEELGWHSVQPASTEIVDLAIMAMPVSELSLTWSDRTAGRDDRFVDQVFEEPNQLLYDTLLNW